MAKGFLRRRGRSDRGGSDLITFVFVMPLFFMFIITALDASIFMANRSVVQQIARDGARQVAIFGGTGTQTTMSPIEKAYGASASSPVCGTSPGLMANRSSVECQVLTRLSGNTGLTNVSIQRVNCGPGLTLGGIGTETYCDIEWEYGGLPGAALTFLKNSEGDPALKDNRTRVTSQSEVNMTGISLVPR